MQRPTLTHYTGTRILPILQERERSRAWFARKCGMHNSHVHRVLMGQLPISTYFVERACAVLDMPEDTLFFSDHAMQACLPTAEVA
jgi:hypothetical protein